MTRIIGTLCLLLLVVGCMTTPKSVLDTSQYQLQGLSVLQGNTNTIIDTYNAEVKKVMEDGYQVWLQGAEKELTDSEGKVILEEYKALMAALADTVQQKEAFYDDKAGSFKGKMNAQFFDIILLGTLLKDYNESTGITRETWDRMITTGQGIAESIISIEAERKQERIAAAKLSKEQQKEKFRKVLDFFKQNRASLPQSVDWDSVFSAVDSSGVFNEE